MYGKYGNFILNQNNAFIHDNVIMAKCICENDITVQFVYTFTTYSYILLTQEEIRGQDEKG